MKIVCISDTHGRHREFNLPDGDLLIHAGDFIAASELGRDFLEWFSNHPHKHKVFIAGNHDRITEKKPDEFLNYIREHFPDIHYLCDSGCIIDGLKIWGSPITPWFLDWAWNRNRGEEIRKHWDMIPSNTDILVTHGPRHGILDEVQANAYHAVPENVGC